MSGNDYLNQLLDEARQEPPVLNIEEVHSLINEVAPAKASSKPIFSSTLKLIIMSSLSTAIVLLLLVWSKNPDATNNATATKITEQETEIDHLITSQKPEQKPQNQNTEYLAEQEDYIIPATAISTKLPSEIANPNKFMELSNEELEALHFKVRDGILEFKNELDPHATFLLRMTNKPSFSATTGNFEKGALTAMTDIFPIMVSDEQGTNAIWFNYNHSEFERKWLTDNLLDFVPLRIKLDNQGKEEYPNVMVFWFLRNEAFLAALPDREKDLLHNKKYYYAYNADENFGESHKETEFNRHSITFEPTKTAILPPNQAININEAVLSDLYFSIGDTGICYQRDKAQWDYMTFEFTIQNTSNGRGDFTKELDKPNKYPAFISSDNADELNLSTFLASSQTKDKNITTFFNTEKDQLIPLSYDVRNSTTLSTEIKNKWGADKMIFWYYPSEELMQKLAKNNIETQLAGTPYTTLNSQEWAKLHVKMQGDIFEYNCQPKENSFYRSRALISSHNLMGTYLHNITPLLNEAKMFVPFGHSKADGTEFYSISKKAIINANSALENGELVGFIANTNTDFVVWYQVERHLLVELPELKNQIENRDLGAYPKTFVEYEYQWESPQADGLNYSEKTAIYANVQQMQDLGFTLSPTQIGLHQKVGKGNIDFYYAKDDQSFSYIEPSLKIFKKPLEILPVFISENYGEYCLQSFTWLRSEYKGKDGGKEFRANRHKFVPVIYDLPFDDSLDLVVWYEPSFELFEKLGVNGTQQNAIRAELERFTASQVVHNTNSIKDPTFEELFVEGSSQVSGIRLLELDAETLSKLGIYAENDGIVHINGPITSKYDKRGSSHIFQIDTTKSTAGISLKPNAATKMQLRPGNKFKHVAPKIITDDLAQYWRLYQYDNTMPIDHDNSRESMKVWMMENINSSFLIPVIVRTGQEYTAVDRLMKHARPDCIFWYTPTEEFLSKLPIDIANNIRREMMGIAEKEEIETPFEIDLSKLSTSTNQDSVSSCNYFEVCENTKGAISDYSVYPNPARSMVNVQLQSTETCQALVTVSSINGQVFKREKVQLQKEVETIAQIKLDGLSEGMYLVTIETTAGDHFSQRIVKVN